MAFPEACGFEWHGRGASAGAEGLGYSGGTAPDWTGFPIIPTAARKPRRPVGHPSPDGGRGSTVRRRVSMDRAFWKRAVHPGLGISS